MSARPSPRQTATTPVGPRRPAEYRSPMLRSLRRALLDDFESGEMLDAMRVGTALAVGHPASRLGEMLGLTKRQVADATRRLQRAARRL